MADSPEHDQQGVYTEFREQIVLLVRMRFYPVLFAGDLKQVFLQVHITHAEREALKFPWAADENAETETLRFTRALFGLAPSPFLFGGVIQEHLQTWENRSPELVAELRKCFMLMIISSKSTVNVAKELKQESTKVFKHTNFTSHNTSSILTQQNWKTSLQL